MVFQVSLILDRSGGQSEKTCGVAPGRPNHGHKTVAGSSNPIFFALFGAGRASVR